MPLATGLWPFLVLLGLKLYVLSLLVPKTCVRMLAGYLALPSARLILGLRESLYKAERYFGPRILFSLMSHRDIGSQGQSNLFCRGAYCSQGFYFGYESVMGGSVWLEWKRDTTAVYAIPFSVTSCRAGSRPTEFGSRSTRRSHPFCANGSLA